MLTANDYTVRCVWLTCAMRLVEEGRGWSAKNLLTSSALARETKRPAEEVMSASIKEGEALARREERAEKLEVKNCQARAAPCEEEEQTEERG